MRYRLQIWTRRGGKEALEKVKAIGAQSVFVQTDVSQPDAVKKWMELTIEKFGFRRVSSPVYNKK